MKLAAAVIQHEQLITSASDIFGELDSLLALAWAAEKYRWVAPEMTCCNVLDITEGRHPLQELLVPAFIPNDCSLVGGVGDLENGSQNLEDSTADDELSSLRDNITDGSKSSRSSGSDSSGDMSTDSSNYDSDWESESNESDIADEENYLGYGSGSEVSEGNLDSDVIDPDEQTESGETSSSSGYTVSEDEFGMDFSVSDVQAKERIEEQPSMLILTGPNNSGKSVYMRQVGLIVFLAHIGSYVPATRAIIGVTDRILTRIATRETALDDESAFMVDVKQAAFTMNFATRRSLVLADEFGKGTSAEDGSALFAAYVENFLRLGVNRPKVIVGTHFHGVFSNGLLEHQDCVRFAHMNTRLNPDAQEAREQVVYLFRLHPGLESSSLGISCASMNSIEDRVLDRAQHFVSLLENDEDLRLAYEVISDKERRAMEQVEEITRRFLAAEIPKTHEVRADGDAVRDMIWDVLGPQEEESGGIGGYNEEDVHMQSLFDDHELLA